LFWEQQRDGGMKTANKNYNSAYKMVWRRWVHFIPPVDIIFLITTTHLDYTMRRVQARARAEELGASLSSAEDQPLNASMAGLNLTPPADDAAPIQQVGGLTLDYQERLQRKHLDWFTQPIAHPLGGPAEGIRCIHVCADDPFHIDDGSLQRLAEMLASHIVQQMKTSLASLYFPPSSSSPFFPSQSRSQRMRAKHQANHITWHMLATQRNPKCFTRVVTGVNTS